METIGIAISLSDLVQLTVGVKAWEVVLSYR